jgi:virulence-associated protein VagC
MGSVILYAEKLNLPETFAVKMRGRKVEITEKDNILTIKPVQSPISAARGMLKGGHFGTATLIEQKRIEKELEYGEQVHS